jgi:hypothetical protein
MKELRNIVVIILALYLSATISPWYLLALAILLLP